MSNLNFKAWIFLLVLAVFVGYGVFVIVSPSQVNLTGKQSVEINQVGQDDLSDKFVENNEIIGATKELMQKYGAYKRAQYEAFQRN